MLDMIDDCPNCGGTMQVQEGPNKGDKCLVCFEGNVLSESGRILAELIIRQVKEEMPWRS